MRHAIILKALNLPLVASLVICIVIVAIHPLHVTDGRSRSTVPEVVESAAESAPDLALDELIQNNELLMELITETEAITVSIGDGPIVLLSEKAPRNESSIPSDGRRHDRHAVAMEKNSAEENAIGELALWEQVVPLREYSQEFAAVAPQASTRRCTALAAAASQLARAWHRASVDSSLTETATTTTTEAPVVAEADKGQRERPFEPLPRIRITNPAANGYTVAFLRNEEVVTLPAGDSIDHTGETVTIRFDRGNGQGAVVQELVPGTYRFSVSDQGWSLDLDEPDGF